MKYKRFEYLKGIVGVLLCLASLLGIYYWENYGRAVYTTKDIIVLSEAVKPLTVIEPSQLKLVRREVDSLIENPITDPSEIVGKVAKHYVPANTQLDDMYFESLGLIPGDGEYIFKLPNEWIASMPSTLRRSDDAFIYPVFRGDSDTTPVEEMPDPIKCLKIAFVRNQSNQEVKSVGDTDRQNANSNVSSVELIATMEDVIELNTLRMQGFKFIIMYR